MEPAPSSAHARSPALSHALPIVAPILPLQRQAPYRHLRRAPVPSAAKWTRQAQQPILTTPSRCVQDDGVMPLPCATLLGYRCANAAATAAACLPPAQQRPILSCALPPAADPAGGRQRRGQEQPAAAICHRRIRGGALLLAAVPAVPLAALLAAFSALVCDPSQLTRARRCRPVPQLTPTIGVDFKAKMVQIGGKTVVRGREGVGARAWALWPCCAVHAVACSCGLLPGARAALHN